MSPPNILPSNGWYCTVGASLEDTSHETLDCEDDGYLQGGWLGMRRVKGREWRGEGEGEGGVPNNRSPPSCNPHYSQESPFFPTSPKHYEQILVVTSLNAI